MTSERYRNCRDTSRLHRPNDAAEGALWFTTVEKINGIYYMWHEGYGGGTARTKAYGTYLEGGKSQIGLATLKAEYFYVDPLKIK